MTGKTKDSKPKTMRGIPLTNEIILRMRQLFLLMDENDDRKPALSLRGISEKLGEEFGRSVRIETISRQAKKRGWTQLRNTSKLIDTKSRKEQVKQAIVDTNEGTNLLEFAAKYTKTLDAVTGSSAKLLARYLSAHAETWERWDRIRREGRTLTPSEREFFHDHLMKPDTLIKILGMGSNLANNNVLQIFIAKYEQTVNDNAGSEDDPVIHGWEDDGNPDPPMPPPIGEGRLIDVPTNEGDPDGEVD